MDKDAKILHKNSSKMNSILSELYIMTKYDVSLEYKGD